jgi:hypothetical protein
MNYTRKQAKKGRKKNKEISVVSIVNTWFSCIVGNVMI